ncbi:sigma-54-dependent Fis family transcriptional regulator [Pseudonocardia acaciae]|uniref:sigma-54-dependent Fis family transcriptional regulator n=1 Tax=Pseudonocardia acaciae TaxID=551276 RepID=UPI000B123512|nr:helix-turn-helix domain-containing protein [Pseudonocardia acaciae]
MTVSSQRRLTGENRPAAAGPGSDELADARISFLLDEGIVPGVVREPILASWSRSRDWHVPSDHLDLPYAPDLDFDSVLARAASRVLHDVAGPLAAEPVSLIVCDARGSVLRRHTGDSTLEHHLDRVLLAPGFSYAEQHVGTNGIGTALESGGPAQVFGHEHYVEHLEELACAGVPIRHPVTRKVCGVVDLTCWRRDAGTMMVATMATLARRIEEALLEQAGRRERALLDDYLMACRRNRGAVLAVGEDLLMISDRARDLLDPIDQEPLLAAARDVLASGRTHQIMVDLPSGRTARVLCKPSFTERGVTGGVLHVQLVAPVAEYAAAGQAGAGAAPPRRGRPVAVGSTPLWMRCVQAIDWHFRAREWVVLQGEPGTGKVALARSCHQGRSPASHLRVLDAADFGPRWLDEVGDELEGGGSLVLTHIDRLSPDAAVELAEVLEPRRESTHPARPWVVATASHVEPADHLAELLACFPRTIEVPPLRHHLEDIAELVPHLLARLARGAPLRCSPAAMRVLMRNRWPGNVEQLYRVLRKIATKRRSGVVEVGDLPPECHATTRRVLTRLEALECDAIVDALLATGGNKTEAAQLLHMSRATIYRKIHSYGI